MTVAETIKQITRDHLTKNHGLALGQCLTAVGWVGGTVPEMREEDGLVELSMADVAGGGVAVGLALAGRRPIYIVRYQGFQWYNAPIIVNYAAKSKEMWGIPCPIFIRSIAMDGAIGPVASGSHHGIYARMPGVPICAPMTPKEYQAAWDYFMSHDDPLYVSEHRRSFSIDYEMEDVIVPDADITLFAISATRLNALEAVKTLQERGVKCNLVHLLWLKPFVVDDRIRRALQSSRVSVVLDGDFANGVAKSLAYDLMHESDRRVFAMGLEERTGGFAAHLDNLPPTPSRIVSYVERLVRSDVLR
jgi:pyruvate dehydrogenase E1 component beta subunit